MRIAYDNLIDDLTSTALSVTSSVTGYSVINVQDQRLGLRWRSTSAAAQTVTLDFGVPVKVNTVGILGHNIDLGYMQNVQRLSSETVVYSLVSLGSGVALAGTSPTGEIFKSSDSGSSWSLIQRLSSETAIRSLVSFSSTTVLAGTGTSGNVFRSLDSGSSWSLIQRLSSETVVYSLASLGSGIVLAGTTTAKIYKSTDSGSSWSFIQRLGSENGAYSLVSLGSGIVLAGTDPLASIYRSSDSGSSWSLIQRLGSEEVVRSLVSLGSGVVLAGTSPTGGVYKSTDSGSSWSLIQRLGSEEIVRSLVSLGSGIVLASTNPTGYIYRSSDSGSSWSQLSRLGSETDILSLVSLGSGVALAGTSPTGQIYRSITYLTIAGNAANSWTAPSVLETLSWNSGAIMKFITDAHYRYWRFSVDNRTNEDGFVEIGRLWLGSYLAISPSSLVDFKVVKKRSDTVIYGKDRQKFAVSGVGWRRFELAFPSTGYGMIKSIEDMYDHVGNHSSFIFCNFDDLRSYQIVEPCYVSIDGEIGLTHAGNMKFSYGLNMEEDL